MLKTESYKKGIVLSTGLNIIVKAILFFNTIVIAWYFGTSIDTDLYFYIFSTITLIAAFINGIDMAVILPEGMHLREEKGEDEAIAFYNFFGFFYLLLGLLIFVVLFFFSVPVFSTISSYKTAFLSKHTVLLIFSSILPILIILSNYYTAVLTTLKYFTAPLIANGIVQLFGITSLVIFHNKLGIVSGLIGMAVGYLLNISLLLFFMYFRLHWHFRFSAKHITKKIKKNIASVQMGNLATVAFNYTIIIVLSSLPIGIYTAYNYGMQIISIPNNFIISQASAVVSIKFNELSAKNLRTELNRIFLLSIEVLLFFIIPFCILTYIFANVIVDFLYLRGGFNKESSEKVVFFLQYLIFLSPCYAINTFVTRLMTAEKKVSQSFYFQLGFNISALIIIILVTKLFKQTGFIWAMLSAYYFYICFVCIFLFKWIMPYISYEKAVKSLLLIFLYNIPFLLITHIACEQRQPVLIFIVATAVYFLAVILINQYVVVSKSTKLLLSEGMRAFLKRK